MQTLPTVAALLSEKLGRVCNLQVLDGAELQRDARPEGLVHEPWDVQALLTDDGREAPALRILACACAWPTPPITTRLERARIWEEQEGSVQRDLRPWVT